MFRLALKNFFDQIVQHKTVAAGESLDKTGGVFPPLHGEGGQLQTGDPAFGAGFQAAMSSAERLRPITWLRNSAASAGVKRRSAARSSVNWPRAR